MAISENRFGAVQGYTVYQIGLHWLIATLVFAQLIFGESMTEAIEAAEDGETVSALDAYLAGMHYYFGIAVLALVAVRLPDCPGCWQHEPASEGQSRPATATNPRHHVGV